MKTITRYLFLALFAAAPLMAQTEEEPNPFETSDSTVVIETDTTGATFSDESFFQGLPETRVYLYEDTPFIEFILGNSLPSYDQKFDNPLFDPRFNRDDYAMHNIAEIKIGFKDLFRLTAESDILGTNGQYCYISNVNFNIIKGINDTLSPREQQLESWRLGFANLDGYGYKLGDWGDIQLNHATGINWSVTTFRKDSTYGLSYNLAGRRLGKNVRFGENYESSVVFTPYQHVSLGASYEQSVIYPRHVFWYWAASKVVEASAFGLLGWFVDEVEDRAPVVVPIVNFALKTGLSYGYYRLIKREMNWPIATEPPFMFDNFKFSLAVNF